MIWQRLVKSSPQCGVIQKGLVLKTIAKCVTHSLERLDRKVAAIEYIKHPGEAIPESISKAIKIWQKPIR